ncbi:MAG: hypothetical protein Q4D26_11630 [Clostridia bacterium]|nr:hypothetical protein [Clostridia bacterium]
MARRKRNESPERQELREMMLGYLNDNSVRYGKYVNSIIREMISVILEGTLDGEFDYELGYSNIEYTEDTTPVNEFKTDFMLKVLDHIKVFEDEMIEVTFLDGTTIECR